VRLTRLNSGTFNAVPSLAVRELAYQSASYKRSKVQPSGAERHARAECAAQRVRSGDVNTPTLSRLANAGISYNRFHNAAMCSPTRAALLTGRNHHRVGNGQIAEFANDWDGYSGVIPRTAATVAKVLGSYGYSSSAFGKWTIRRRTRPPRSDPI
jgi:arylsulfatase A-like enzyme